MHLSGNIYYLFFSYRIDMFIFPLGLLAIAVLLFGIRNIKKFTFIALYALFASPALLVPLFSLNPGFANVNTLLVYHISKLFLSGLQYSAPITLVLNGVSVSIGETCVGIGALIGIVMFLIPIAYLFDGKPKDKLKWVASGFLLLLVLNFIRMLVIALLWFVNGPSDALINLHAVIGQIIFYAVIVVMVMLAGRYGMKYPQFRPPKVSKKDQNRHSVVAIILAILLAIFYYLMTLTFLNAQVISPILISSATTVNFTYGTVVPLLNSTANLQNYTSQSFISNDSKSVAVAVYNLTDKKSMPLALVFGVPNVSIERQFASGTTLYKVDSHGNIVRMFYISSANTSVFVYYRKMPYKFHGNYTTIDMYAVLSLYPYWQGNCETSNQQLRDSVTNILYVNFPSSTVSNRMTQAYCLISKVIK